SADTLFLFGAGAVPLGWDAFDALVSLSARTSTRPEMVQLFVRISAEATDPAHPAHDWLTRHYGGLRAWLSDAIDRGIAEGTMKEELPKDATIATASAVRDGRQQQWVCDSTAGAMTDAVRAHLRGLKTLWGLGPPSSRQARAPGDVPWPLPPRLLEDPVQHVPGESPDLPAVGEEAGSREPRSVADRHPVLGVHETAQRDPADGVGLEVPGRSGSVLAHFPRRPGQHRGHHVPADPDVQRRQRPEHAPLRDDQARLLPALPQRGVHRGLVGIEAAAGEGALARVVAHPT